MNDNLPPSPLVTSKRIKVVVGLIAVVAVGVVAFGVLSRHSDADQLAGWTQKQMVPAVTVVHPSRDAKGAVLLLPGRLEAFNSAPIYARVSGYLKTWYTDIGTQVKEGQVLGIIETPDLDHQLEQARADLASAKANEALAETTAQRWQMLFKTDVVSLQAVEEKNGDWATKKALVTAAQANVDRLQSLEGFKRIVAPFDGVVTSRDTDIGALIDAGGGHGPQLFTVSDVHRLRAYVNVPQDEATAIYTGMTAQLILPGKADRSFTAVVVSTSGAVNVESGAVLVELSVADSSGSLIPGDFVNVQFEISGKSNFVRLPARSLIFRSSNLEVAVVDSTNHIKLKTVTLQRDLGQWVEIATGVGPDDQVVETPSDALSDGDEVRIMAPPSNAKAP